MGKSIWSRKRKLGIKAERMSGNGKRYVPLHCAVSPCRICEAAVLCGSKIQKEKGNEPFARCISSNCGCSKKCNIRNYSFGLIPNGVLAFKVWGGPPSLTWFPFGVPSAWLRNVHNMKDRQRGREKGGPSVGGKN